MIVSSLFTFGIFLLGGACGALLAHRKWIALARTIRGQLAETFVSVACENSRPTELGRGFRNLDGTIDLAALNAIVEQKQFEIARLSAEVESLRTLIPLLNSHVKAAPSYAA
jgi:hypothetical protein